MRNAKEACLDHMPSRENTCRTGRRSCGCEWGRDCPHGPSLIGLTAPRATDAGVPADGRGGTAATLPEVSGAGTPRVPTRPGMSDDVKERMKESGVFRDAAEILPQTILLSPRDVSGLSHPGRVESLRETYIGAARGSQSSPTSSWEPSRQK